MSTPHAEADRILRRILERLRAAAPADAARVLAEAQAGLDSAQRARLERLLSDKGLAGGRSSTAEGPGVTRAPATGSVALPDSPPGEFPDSPPGTEFGRYRLLERLGAAAWAWSGRPWIPGLIASSRSSRSCPTPPRIPTPARASCARPGSRRGCATRGSSRSTMSAASTTSSTWPWSSCRDGRGTTSSRRPARSPAARSRPMPCTASWSASPRWRRRSATPTARA